jgi:uncharacterized protein
LTPATAHADGALSAGGTIERDDPSSRWKLWLWLELAAIFIGAPVLVREVVHGAKVPLFLALLPVFFIAAGLLLADRSFRFKSELKRGFSAFHVVSILVLFAAGTAGVAAWILKYHPDWYLEFPNSRPDVYARILLLYPFASVAVQELVYRTFFFHRYGALFKGARWLGVAANGLLFGFGHIVIGSPFAMLATAATGTLFAARYAATRSYWAVMLEHTLWGSMAFTLGLGRFFFTGVSNL